MSHAGPHQEMDRRRQPRVEIEMPVVYRLLTRSKLYPGRNAGEAGVPARVKNLSQGGALLMVWERLLQHSVVSLTLALPGLPSPVRTLAEVRHLQDWMPDAENPFAAGLEFLSISNQDLMTLRQFVFNAKLS